MYLHLRVVALQKRKLWKEIEAENVDIEILVQSNKTMVSFSRDANRIQFYVYKLSGDIKMLKQDRTIVKVKNIEIIDSEATSITYIR